MNRCRYLESIVTSGTYLKGVQDYNLRIIRRSEHDFSVIIKHILKVKAPFFIEEDGDNVCLIDSDYFVLELVPDNEPYILRVHLDRNKNILEYFFCISKKNFIDANSNIPSYDTYHLSVVSYKGKNKIYDNGKLKQELSNKRISEIDYESAHLFAIKLLKELEVGNNRFINMDFLELLGEFNNENSNR